MAAPDLKQLIDRCDRFLSHHNRESVADTLTKLAAEATADDRRDVYGRGGVIESFESHVAELLGKPAAVFMPSGTMAQQIALRIHCDRSGIGAVAYHPTSHLELHEQQGLAELHNIRSRLVGRRTALMTAKELAVLPGEVSTLLVELPQREIGGALPSWEDLESLVGVARDRDMMVHLDGARVWQCEPFYARTSAEISALFDTVYVSFYKIIGGIAGAVLAGPADFIKEARLWQRRYGGNLVHLYPLVLSARAGLRERQAKMAEYHERAVRIARVISEIDGVRVSPDPPATNMMHVYVAAAPAAVERERSLIASEEKVLLFGQTRDCGVPETACFEVSIGDASAALGDDELKRWFSRLANPAG